MIDGGDDGMPIDNNVANCGNGISEPGEICFKAPLRIDLGITGVFDAQFVDANGDGQRDLAFLTATGYAFRINNGGIFSNVNTSGPGVPGSTRMRGVNLGGSDAVAELVDNNKMTGTVEIWEWNGAAHARIGMIGSETNDAQGIAVGRTTGASDPPSIAMVFTSRLRIFQLPTGDALSPLAQSGSGFAITGGKDVAVGDIDKDLLDEIAVANNSGLEVFRNVSSTIVKISSPNIGGGADAVVTCDVDGDQDDEFVYSIKSTAGGPGRVGAARWMAASWEPPAPRTIPGMSAPVDCADFDKDGHDDAVVVATTGGDVDTLILRGRADGAFEAPIPFRILDGVTQIHANVDFNNDEVPDIIMTSPVMGLVTILQSNP